MMRDERESYFNMHAMSVEKLHDDQEKRASDKEIGTSQILSEMQCAHFA